MYDVGPVDEPTWRPVLNRGRRVRPYAAISSVGGRTWIVLSQGAGSASNLLLAVVVARVSSAADFGYFALMFAVYTFILSALRAIFHERLLFGATGVGAVDSLRSLSVGHATILVGAGVSVAGSVIAALGHTAHWSGLLLTFALAIPFLLVQDQLRYGAFAGGRDRVAAAMDWLWLVLFSGFLVAVSAVEAPTVLLVVGVWGAAGALSCLIEARRIGAVFRSIARFSPRDLRGLPSWSAGVEWFATNVVSLALPILLVALARAEDAGALRGAQTFLGGLQIVYSSASVYLQAYGRRTVLEARPVRLKFAAVLGLLVGAAVVNIALVWIAPGEAGAFLLGATWDAARDLIIVVGLLQIAGAVVLVAGAALRVHGQVHRGAAVRVMMAVVGLVAFTLAAIYEDAMHALLALAVVNLLGGGLYFVQLGKSRRRVAAPCSSAAPGR